MGERPYLVDDNDFAFVLRLDATEIRMCAGPKQVARTTITAGLSFTLLVAMKLWGSFSRARKDNRNKSASSAYLTENASFNVLDPDYVAKHYVAGDNTVAGFKEEQVLM